MSSHSHSSRSTLSNSTSMSMSSMASSMPMVFYSSTKTPLFSTAWTPKSVGAYAGTCIFLILLGMVFRGLFAGKLILERRWLDKQLDRRYIKVRGDPTESERIDTDANGKNGVLVTARGIEEHVRVVKSHVRPIMAWRLSVDVPRAAYVTVMAGVGYLLMLAVMTMNVGYFLSVLGGIFVGELAAGRYAQLEEHTAH